MAEVPPHFNVTCQTMAHMVTLATLVLGGAVAVVGGVGTGDGGVQKTMGITVVEHPPH